MCCIWALNPVHAKTKTPIFYSEIVAKSARFYYWMMNAHLQHRRRHHCCPDDGSKLCYWNWNQWRYKEDKKRNDEKCAKKPFREFDIIYRTTTLSTKAADATKAKNQKIHCNSYSFIHNSLELSNWHTIKLNSHFFISLLHDFHIFFHWRLHEILSDEMSRWISIQFSLNNGK